MSGAVCTNVVRVLDLADDHIRDIFDEFDKATNDPACSRGEYYIDAAIAILEIGLLLVERTKRLATPKVLSRAGLCPCQAPMRSPALSDISRDQSTCPVRAYMWHIPRTLRLVSPFNDDFWLDSDSEFNGSKDDEDYSNAESNESEDDEETIHYWRDWGYWEDESQKGVIEEVIRVWVIAVGYATPDGSPHAIRSVILEYVDLPTMLPHPGPNDEPEDVRPRWLCDAVRAVHEILVNMRIPERKMEAVPDFAEMSI